MTASLQAPDKPPGVRRPILTRAVLAVAEAVRYAHREQALMWECWWRVSRVPADRPGALAWEPSLDGPRLTGNYLPAPDNAGGTP